MALCILGLPPACPRREEMFVGLRVDGFPPRVALGAANDDGDDEAVFVKYRPSLSVAAQGQKGEVRRREELTYQPLPR